MHGSVTFFSGFRGMKSCHVAPCREVHCKPEILALPFPGCDSALLVEYLLLWGGPGLQDSSLIVPQFGFGILSRSCTLLFLPSPPSVRRNLSPPPHLPTCQSGPWSAGPRDRQGPLLPQQGLAAHWAWESGRARHHGGGLHWDRLGRKPTR